VTERDQFIQSQVTPMLAPGEQALHTAYVVRQPGLLWQLLLVGGLFLFLMTKAYYAVLTNRRLILIRTRQGFWKPAMENVGVEQYDVTQMVQCTTSGFANNRSMTFHFQDGSKQTWRIAPWLKWVTGTGEFFKQVPDLISSRQLAHGGGGAAPALGAGGMAPPGAYGGGPTPGMMVTVLGPDGHRYHGQVMQVQGGNVLCTMQNGTQHWVPMQHVAPA
jgi:hypothetical protein